MKAWIDGEFVPQAEAKVPILSHSFSRGSAIFEVLDVVASAEAEVSNRSTSRSEPRPALFRIDAHVDRFFSSAEFLHMSLPLSKGELVEAVKQTVRVNAVTDGAVKFFGYCGSPELGLMPKDTRGQVAIFCFDVPGILGRTRRDATQPVTVGMSTVRKLSPVAVPVHAKAAGHYVNAFLAGWEVVQKGYDEVVMLDQAGFVAEGALTNVFFVRNGAVMTPKLNNALAGVTRDSVIEITKAMGLALVEADVSSEQATSADEAFFTGTVIRIKPIRAIEGRPLGDSCPGPVTRRIRKALDDAYEGATGGIGSGSPTSSEQAPATSYEQRRPVDTGSEAIGGHKG